MGRLIDAEQAKLMLSELLEVAEKENFTAEDAINHACVWVDNIPTAYDVEKVMDQLEENQTINFHFTGEKPTQTIDYETAIDIVKRGGVE